MTDLRRQRERMVAEQLAGRGITDQAVLAAFLRVPREAFVPAALASAAYEEWLPRVAKADDVHPTWVALIASALELRGQERLLEIGTGSGYAAAILGQLAEHVFTTEPSPTLARLAEQRFARAQCGNVRVVAGEGLLGCAEHAPYDAMVVIPVVEQLPAALFSQLTVGGKMVVCVPIGETSQLVKRVTRVSTSRYREEDLALIRYINPLPASGSSLAN